MADETRVDISQVDGTDDSPDYAGLTRAVRDLVQVMHQGELERLEISQGDLRILLCARSTASGAGPANSAPDQHAPQESVPDQSSENGNFHHITSPMVGTFYEAPSPGEPPYVRPGDTVEAGQTVAIIEAMKIMNEIVADRPGLVDAILVENGETVEYGHPIFRLRPV